jgi:hypothetical protein
MRTPGMFSKTDHGAPRVAGCRIMDAHDTGDRDDELGDGASTDGTAPFHEASAALPGETFHPSDGRPSGGCGRMHGSVLVPRVVPRLTLPHLETAGLTQAVSPGPAPRSCR